jgi:hypothetical protein
MISWLLRRPPSTQISPLNTVAAIAWIASGSGATSDQVSCATSYAYAVCTGFTGSSPPIA